MLSFSIMFIIIITISLVLIKLISTTNMFYISSLDAAVYAPGL